MRLAGLVTVLALSVATGARGAGPSADILYGTAFFRSGATRWEDAPIVSAFGAETVQGIPAMSGAFMMIGLSCFSLRPDGELGKCKIAVEPESDALLGVARRMAKEIRIAPDFARPRTSNVKFVYVQIRVSNSDVPLTGGPCWPPSCSFLPALPVPPAR